MKEIIKYKRGKEKLLCTKLMHLFNPLRNLKKRGEREMLNGLLRRVSRNFITFLYREPAALLKNDNMI